MQTKPLAIGVIARHLGGYWEFQPQIVTNPSHSRDREPGRMMRESAQRVATI